jgi:hypothetical protein
MFASNLLSFSLSCRLPGQCQYLGLPVADYFKQWINLKKVLSEPYPGPSSGSPMPHSFPLMSVVFLFLFVLNISSSSLGDTYQDVVVFLGVGCYLGARQLGGM